MKAWRMRGCLIKFLNSLSLRKKKNTNYNQPKLFEMPNKNTLLGFHTVLFIPPFLSCSPCKNSECFSFYSDFPCFFLPPLLLCHLIMGTEAWSQKKGPVWIPFAWQPDQPACPKLLPGTLPLAALHLLYFPFFLSLRAAQISVSH